MTKPFPTVLLMIPIAFLLLFNSVVSWASSSPEDSSPLELRGNWAYHWGDLDRNDATKQWQYNNAKWHQINFPENIPGRQNENIVWLKINLPSGQWRDPHLYLNSVDLTLQVFQNHNLLYSFGEIDEKGNSSFEGWPWHVIKLPNNFDQHTLYFRVFSNYPSIGVSGIATIGNRFNLLEDVYSNGVAGLTFILIVILVGVISTAMGTIKQDRAVAISTGILSFNLAIMMFSENELSQLIFFSPLTWRYIAAFSYFLIPAFLAIIVLAWLRDKPPKTAQLVLIISLLFFIGVALLSTLTSFNFVNAYPYFDVLFIVLVLSLLIGCTKQFYQRGLTGSLMTFGILALFLSLLLDMLNAHAFIDWIGLSGQWGLTLFTLASLLIYLVRDWQQQEALTGFTKQLESKVAIRTSELMASEEKLKQLAREDYLTSLMNRRAFIERAMEEINNANRHKRPISLIMFDLDHFKDINDKYGHAIGDLVLKAVALACSNTCRDSELVCRYGGEEFVILLHDTNLEHAESLATRLCEAIKEIKVEHEGISITITASFGLVSIKDSNVYKGTVENLLERLISEADKAMYEVKDTGRNGIKTHEL